MRSCKHVCFWFKESLHGGVKLFKIKIWYIQVYMAWKLNTHRIFLLNVLNLGYAFLLLFFCNHRNLLFSIVSENSSIGTRSCKWDPLKNIFGVRTVRLKKRNFFTSVISSYTAYMVTKSQISPNETSDLREIWKLCSLDSQWLWKKFS